MCKRSLGPSSDSGHLNQLATAALRTVELTYWQNAASLAVVKQLRSVTPPRSHPRCCASHGWLTHASSEFLFLDDLGKRRETEVGRLGTQLAALRNRLAHVAETGRPREAAALDKRGINDWQGILDRLRLNGAFQSAATS